LNIFLAGGLGAVGRNIIYFLEENGLMENINFIVADKKTPITSYIKPSILKKFMAK
jgi:hypothetical protein